MALVSKVPLLLQLACRSLFSAATISVAIVLSAGTAEALEKVRFGTDWLAEADHGGFYQALADGTYAAYGLDVEIIQGGPGAANRARLLARNIDFYLGTPQEQLEAVDQGIPLVDVAAFYQKNAQVILAHADSEVETFADLAKLGKIYMSQGGFGSYFQWMKSQYSGFRDEQFRVYGYSSAPFIADSNSAQQGLLTAEPFDIARATGVEPKVFLLADAGYNPYATTITVHRDLLERKPELVQRFVDASIQGWYNYLYGKGEAANAMIKAANPEMTDAQIQYAIDKIRAHGIVDSGDALIDGIGCLRSTRYDEFARLLVQARILKGDADYSLAYDTRFTCRGVRKWLKE